MVYVDVRVFQTGAQGYAESGRNADHARLLYLQQGRIGDVTIGATEEKRSDQKVIRQGRVRLRDHCTGECFWRTRQERRGGGISMGLLSWIYRRKRTFERAMEEERRRDHERRLLIEKQDRDIHLDMED